MVVIGDDWRKVPPEPDDTPSPPLQERAPPKPHLVEPEDGSLPDPLGHWEEVYVDE
jgi:hypothetical protein